MARPMYELTPQEIAILGHIERYKHPTTEQLWRLAIPDRPKRYTERCLQRLRALGLVDVALVYPDKGAGSPRYYHLLLAGARALGKSRLGSQHYRIEGREAFAARSARIELELMVRDTNWQLCDQELEMRQTLLAALTQMAFAKHNEQYPAHLLAELLPHRLQPDLLLTTPAEVIPIIIAHPFAGSAFWRGRLEKYGAIISQVRAIGIALSDEQQAEARSIVAHSAWPRRFLILQPSELPALRTRLCLAGNRQPGG